MQTFVAVYFKRETCECMCGLEAATLPLRSWAHVERRDGRGGGGGGEREREKEEKAMFIFFAGFLSGSEGEQMCVIWRVTKSTTEPTALACSGVYCHGACSIPHRPSHVAPFARCNARGWQAIGALEGVLTTLPTPCHCPRQEPRGRRNSAICSFPINRCVLDLTLAWPAFPPSAP